MQIDPHAWLLMLPLALGMVTLYNQPRQHALKRFWVGLAQAESVMWFRLTGVPPRRDPERLTPVERTMYWALVAALAAGSGLSLAAYLG